MVSVLSLGVGRAGVTELRDITERVNAEAELSRVWRMLRDAVDNIPNGFAIYGEDQRLILCNAAYAALYDRTPDEMIRSEEHTSELQSLMRISYAVFCLKKKKHTEHAKHKQF